MPANRNPANEAAAFAASATRELAQLRRSLKAAEDNISGLRRTLRVPVPKSGRRSTLASRTRLSVFESAGISSVGSFLGRGLTDAIGSGSFYASGAQMSSLWSDLLQQGQRIL